MAKKFSAIILAAGRGTRMRSPLPKALHPVAGLPMLHRAISSLKGAGADEVRVVVGYGGNLVRQVVEPLGVICVNQEEQKGTGDAVKAAQLETLPGELLIMNGDHPLVEVEDIKGALESFRNQQSDFSVVTCELDKPGSFGRILREQGGELSIVEAREASEKEKQIKEVNVGLYLTRGEILNRYLPQVQLQREGGECYLGDVIPLFQKAGLKVGTIPSVPRVAFGVNSQAELAEATAIVFQKVVQRHLENGVLIIDPKTTYIEETVEIGSGTVIYPGVYIKGRTQIGPFCVLEPNCFVLNSELAEGVQVRAGCYFESVQVRSGAVIGPYARLRPETIIGQGAKVGNFVEMKKVDFGDGAKASHLTYLGDAVVGKGTNIGSGTSTCNYGVDHKKYKTTIGENVFIGSDSQLVAPVSIGDDSCVAAGSVITKDVPPGALAVGRSRQVIKESYKPKS